MLAEKHEVEMKKVHDEKQQLMTSLQQTQADLTDMKEKFNHRCLEAEACKEQLTQALTTAEYERARRADLQKTHSDLQSEFAKVSTLFYYYLTLNFQI
jgi:hypothetical protein